MDREDVGDGLSRCAVGQWRPCRQQPEGKGRFSKVYTKRKINAGIYKKKFLMYVPTFSSPASLTAKRNFEKEQQKIHIISQQGMTNYSRLVLIQDVCRVVSPTESMTAWQYEAWRRRGRSCMLLVSLLGVMPVFSCQTCIVRVNTRNIVQTNTPE